VSQPYNATGSDKHSGKAGQVMNWSQENCLYGKSSLNLRMNREKISCSSRKLYPYTSNSLPKKEGKRTKACKNSRRESNNYYPAV
jgi:hypothetical protein